MYRRYLGINSFFWTFGIYDVCATGQLHIKNSMVERSRSSSFVQLMFTNVYLIAKKAPTLSEGEEVVEGVNRRGMGHETSCLHRRLEGFQE